MEDDSMTLPEGWLSIKFEEVFTEKQVKEIVDLWDYCLTYGANFHRLCKENILTPEVMKHAQNKMDTEIDASFLTYAIEFALLKITKDQVNAKRQGR
jgi:hypothetical protein